MSAEEFVSAGFQPADYVPQDAGYAHGTVYVTFTPLGSLRVFVPDQGDTIEIASGDLYDPVVHYYGPLIDQQELLRITHLLQA